MNERKLQALFAAARGEPAPAPAADFEARVTRAIQCELKASPVSVFDYLDRLCPRLAWAAVLVIGLCVAGDFGLAALHLPGLSDGVAEISEQWLFAVR
jgi:hypothetical protein